MTSGDEQVNDEKLGAQPEPKTDDIDRAPGGADATVLASDVGASVVAGREDTDLRDDHVGDPEAGGPLVADQPLSAQTEDEKVPDEIQEGEEPESDEQATDNTKGEEAPSG